MASRFGRNAFYSSLTLIVSLAGAYAEEGVPSPALAPTTGTAPVAPHAESASAPSEGSDRRPSKGPKRRKVSRGENRENEGTTAPERFEGNTILKSQYFLNGQSLEVDPD